MTMRTRRQQSTAPRPKSARHRELTTKRRGELAELAFTLKAASFGFGVSKPFGDSERYDVILDSRELTSTRRCHSACPILQAAQNRKARARAGTTEAGTLTCPALRALRQTAPHPWCPPHPTPFLWRVQVKCTTHTTEGFYSLDAQRHTGGRAVPYLPGEIDFLAAYIIPEDTWYIMPLEAFLGSTSLLFRRRRDPKPGRYDAYREAWHLLRPK